MMESATTVRPKRGLRVKRVALGVVMVGGLAAAGYGLFADDVAYAAGVRVDGVGVASEQNPDDFAIQFAEAAAAGDEGTVRCASGTQTQAREARMTFEGVNLEGALAGQDYGGSAGTAVYDVDGSRVSVSASCTQVRPWWSPRALRTCSAQVSR